MNRRTLLRAMATALALPSFHSLGGPRPLQPAKSDIDFMVVVQPGAIRAMDRALAISNRYCWELGLEGCGFGFMRCYVADEPIEGAWAVDLNRAGAPLRSGRVALMAGHEADSSFGNWESRLLAAGADVITLRAVEGLGTDHHVLVARPKGRGYEVEYPMPWHDQIKRQFDAARGADVGCGLDAFEAAGYRLGALFERNNTYLAGVMGLVMTRVWQKRGVEGLEQAPLGSIHSVRRADGLLESTQVNVDQEIQPA